MTKLSEIKYVRSDGTFSEFVVIPSGYDKQTKEILFYELIGASIEKPKPRLLLNGKEPYKRLYIQRVFPVVEESKPAN